MNKQELAKEIELQEERLKQLKKIYFKLNNKATLKIGKCFARWHCTMYIYYKIIEVNINKHKPIRAIKVINDQSIEIVDLYLEECNPFETIPSEQFNNMYSKTLETISNYYEQV